jgi:hypothetical protein
MKRALAVATIIAATTFVAGCSAAQQAVKPTATSRTTSASAAAAGEFTRAMASCGLFPKDEGVLLGGRTKATRTSLTLISQPHGKPTDVDTATVRCTLGALGLPAKDAALFDTTAATGGFQTFQWGRYSATLHVTDTLHFEADVFSTGA